MQPIGIKIGNKFAIFKENNKASKLVAFTIGGYLNINNLQKSCYEWWMSKWCLYKRWTTFKGDRLLLQEQWKSIMLIFT